MTKYLLAACLTVLIMATTFFAVTFFNRLTLPFNSEGNYFDNNAGIVYHKQSVLVYGLITFILVLVTVLTGLLARKKFKQI